MSITIEIGIGVNPKFFNYSNQEKKTIINMGLISYLELQNQTDSFFNTDKIKDSLNKEFINEKKILMKQNEEKLWNLKNEYNLKLKEKEQNIIIFKNEYELQLKQTNQNTNILKSNYEQKLKENEQNINILKNDYDQKLKETHQNTNILKSDYDQKIKQTEQNIVSLKYDYEQQLKMSSTKILKLEMQLDNYNQTQNTLLKQQETIYKELIENQRIENQHFKTLIDNSLQSFNISNSNQKGKIGEFKIENLIIQNYPNYDIINVSKQPHQGDYHIKNNTNSIMLEIKNYDSEKIRQSQINKFYYDLDYCKEHNIDINSAIFISINNGIQGKKTIDFEIYKNIPIVYISNLSQDYDKISFAISLLENYNQIKQIHNHDQKAYLINFMSSKIKNISQSIENIEQQYKIIVDIFNYVKQKYEKYTKEHNKNISFVKNVLEEIKTTIENQGILFDDMEDSFLNLKDPQDISKNMLKSIQQQYLYLKNEAKELNTNTNTNTNTHTNTNTNPNIEIQQQNKKIIIDKINKKNYSEELSNTHDEDHNEDHNEDRDEDRTNDFKESLIKNSKKQCNKENENTIKTSNNIFLEKNNNKKFKQIKLDFNSFTNNNNNNKYKNELNILLNDKENKQNSTLTNEINKNNENELIKWKYPQEKTIELWMNEFKWLNKNNNHLFCNICNKKFITNFKKSTFSNHSLIKNHTQINNNNNINIKTEFTI